ncbi:MAG: aminotransferase class III-fold pyridoxal phosphate-dependent enzyme, partial [Hyphomicrobiaceae bacterium]
PAACAAGIATQRIYRDERLFDRAAELSDYLLDAVFELQSLDIVTDVRGYGLIAGIDVKPGNAPGARGSEIQKRLFWNGLHIKFTGDAGILAPPLIADKSHIDELVSVLRQTLTEVA